MSNTGERIKKARQEMGYSQGQLADLAGLSQSAIGNIESNSRKMPREILNIADALKVSPYWLARGTREVTGQPEAQWDDPIVQAVYEVLCAEEEPVGNEHWEGLAARRIVDAIRGVRYRAAPVLTRVK